MLAVPFEIILISKKNENINIGIELLSIQSYSPITPTDLQTNNHNANALFDVSAILFRITFIGQNTIFNA